MPQSSEDSIERLVQLQADIYRSLRSSLPAEWMETELTMPQLKVLLYLLTEGPTRMTDLATGLRVALPTATGIANRLVGQGLIERLHDSDDRRIVTCALTPEGKQDVSRLWAASFDVLREIFRRLSPTEIESLVGSAELMLRATEEHRDDTSRSIETVATL